MSLSEGGRVGWGTIYHQVAINAQVVKDTRRFPLRMDRDVVDKQTPVQTTDGLILEHNPGPEHGVVKLRLSSWSRTSRSNGNARCYRHSRRKDITRHILSVFRFSDGVE